MQSFCLKLCFLHKKFGILSFSNLSFKMLRSLFVFISFISLFSCVDKSRSDYDIPVFKKINTENQTLAGMSILSDAIKNNPSNSENYYKRAVLNFDNYNYNDALIDINRAERLNPNSGLYLFMKAKVQYQLKSKEALLNALASENQDYDNPQLYSLIAALYIEKGDYNKANVYLNKVQSVYPYFSELYLVKGKMFAKRGDTLTAINNYIKAIKLKPHGFNAYDNLIKIYSARGLIDSALVINEQAIKRFPTNTELVYNKGLILESAGSADSAVRVYQRFIKLEPERNDILERIGDIYFRRKNYTSAIIIYQRWATLEPENIKPLLKMADAYDLQKNITSAKKSIEEAIAIEPNNPKLIAELQNYEYQIDMLNRSTVIEEKIYSQRKVKPTKAEPTPEPERRIFGGNFGKIEKIQKRNTLPIGRDTTSN